MPQKFAPNITIQSYYRGMTAGLKIKPINPPGLQPVIRERVGRSLVGPPALISTLPGYFDRAMSI
jgi:hypothetical protein